MKIKNELDKKKIGLANKITIARMVLLPFVFGFLIGGYSMLQSDKFVAWDWKIGSTIIKMNWVWLTGAILFVIASFTDFLDGYVARKRNEITVFGKFLDPIADKLLVNGTLIILAWTNIIPVWVVVIFIARDIIVDAGRMISSSQNVVVAANIFGKLKTVLQLISIPLILFLGTQLVTSVDSQSNNFYESSYLQYLNIPLFIAAIFSVISGIIYIYRMWPTITKTM